MSASAQLGLLLADYVALGKEAGRRHSDVRDVRLALVVDRKARAMVLTLWGPSQAADKAQQLLKSSREQALVELRAGELDRMLATLASWSGRLIRARVDRTTAIAPAALPPDLPRDCDSQLEDHRPRRLELAATHRGRRGAQGGPRRAAMD